MSDEPTLIPGGERPSGRPRRWPMRLLLVLLALAAAVPALRGGCAGADGAGAGAAAVAVMDRDGTRPPAERVAGVGR